MSFENLKYLANINEDFILGNYEAALLNENTLPFENFDDKQQNLYFRLKFRALNRNSCK